MCLLRLANEHGPECIAAVYKIHFANENFSLEACRTLVNLVASEDDDIIPRIALSGIIPMVLKSIKKNPDSGLPNIILYRLHSDSDFSESLAGYVFNLLYLVACNVDLISKLISADILTLLTATFDRHGGYEPLAEWGLRTVYKILEPDLEGLSSKMKNAGLCEVSRFLKNLDNAINNLLRLLSNA